MSLGPLFYFPQRLKAHTVPVHYFASIWLYDDNQIVKYLVPEKEKVAIDNGKKPRRNVGNILQC